MSAPGSTPVARQTSADPTIRCIYKPWMRTTTLCLGIGRGSRNDPPSHPGAAHLFEHLVMSASGLGPSIAVQLDRWGGLANASTGNEATLYFARVANEDAVAAAHALLRAIADPPITAVDLEREQRTIVQELSAGEADPAEAVQDAFLATLFAGHPLGRPVGGSPAGVESFTLDDVRDYHRATSGLARHLVVVGGVTPDEFVDVLPPTSCHPPTFAPPEPGPRGRRGSAPPVRWPLDEGFCWFAAGGVAVPGGHRLAPAFQVLASLLGASPNSLLYRSLRDKHGIAYSFTAWASAYSDAGAWRVLVGVEPSNGSTAMDVVISLLERVATKGAEPHDLMTAVRQSVGTLLRDAEDPVQCAINLALFTGVGTRAWSHDEARLALLAVTEDDVRAAAASVLEAFTMVVRPEASQ